MYINTAFSLGFSIQVLEPTHFCAKPNVNNDKTYLGKYNLGTHNLIYISPKIVQKEDVLLSTNSCAQCTVRPNKLKCSVSRERIIAGLNKESRWLVLKN